MLKSSHKSREEARLFSSKSLIIMFVVTNLYTTHSQRMRHASCNDYTMKNVHVRSLMQHNPFTLKSCEISFTSIHLVSGF